MSLLTKRIAVRGWPYGTGTDCEHTVQFARTNDVKVMVEQFPLDRAQDAFDRVASARFRAVIVP